MKINEKELIRALVNKDFDEIKNLINIFGINSTDRDGRTILTNCVAKNNLDFVKKLLHYEGIDIDHQDMNGYTALHFSVEVGNIDILSILLENKASIDKQDKWGNTPLWRAVHNYPENKHIIERLIDLGANLNVKNKSDVSPLQIIKEDHNSGEYDYSNILSKWEKS
jgi:ankyrin repeat protein